MKLKAILIRVTLTSSMIFLRCLSSISFYIASMRPEDKIVLAFFVSAICGWLNFNIIGPIVFWALTDGISLGKDLIGIFESFTTMHIQESVGSGTPDHSNDEACNWLMDVLNEAWKANCRKRIESRIKYFLQSSFLREEYFGVTPEISVDAGLSSPISISRFELIVFDKKLMIVSDVKGEIEKFLNVKTYQDYNFGVKKIKFSGTIRVIFGTEIFQGVFRKKHLNVMFDNSCKGHVEWSGLLFVLNSPVLQPLSHAFFEKFIPWRVPLSDFTLSEDIDEEEDEITNEANETKLWNDLKRERFLKTEESDDFVDLEVPLGILSVQVLGCSFGGSRSCTPGTEIEMQLSGRKLVFKSLDERFIHNFDFAVTERQTLSDTLRMQIVEPTREVARNNFIGKRGKKINYTELPVSYLVAMPQIEAIVNLIGQGSSKLSFRSTFKRAYPFKDFVEEGIMTILIPDLPFSTRGRFALEIAISGSPPSYERHFGERGEVTIASETVHIPFKSYNWDCIEVKLWKFIPLIKKTTLRGLQDKVNRRLQYLPENILLSGIAASEGVIDADPFPDDDFFDEKIIVSRRQLPLSELNAHYLEIDLGQDVRGHPLNLRLLYNFYWI